VTRALLVASLLALASARGSADSDPSPLDETATLERVREHFARGEYVEAKALLEAAYAASSSPALLFALGQVSFNLGELRTAITYYERFLATNPEPDQAALAQQAIGAARGRLAAPPPPPPRPEPPPVVRTHVVHPWSRLYTGLAIGGSVALVAGGGLIVHGHGLGDDESGTLADYERRLERSRTEQSVGLALGIGGLAVAASAFVLWRVRSETRVIVTPAEQSAGLAVRGAW
jgi:tetratricopeptide (TPR) repeat protein